MNETTIHRLLTLRPGRTRQASSFGRDPHRGGSFFGFRPAPALIKRIFLAPGETHVMASLQGVGVIYRLQMTLLLPFYQDALRNLVIRAYWDGEANPSVESPFGDFFGAPFGQYQFYVSEPLMLTNGTFLSLWPMPYGQSARIEITNQGSRAIDPLFFNLTYVEMKQQPANRLRFHAHWRRENPTRPGIPYTILEAEGRGHYVGCHLNFQNLEWWLKPPLGKILFPYGFGLGIMEGWESIYLDGEETPSLVGTGTEDFFNSSWYFLPDGVFHAPQHGCLVRDLLRARIAAYRFDMDFPIPFTQSLRVLVDHGFRNTMKIDASSTSYWYQEEPHKPFPPLLPAHQRQATSGAANMVQTGVLLGIPAAIALNSLWRLYKHLAKVKNQG